MQTIKHFLNKINTNNVVASLGIIIIFSLIVYLLVIIVISYQERQKAASVRLPTIEGYGEDAFSEPEFEEPKKFIVELVDLNEEVPQNSNIVDERKFINTLMLESKRYISHKNIQMPKIEQMTILNNTETNDKKLDTEEINI